MSIVLKDGDQVGTDAGIHTTVAASDTIQTGLRKVVYAVATLQSDPITTAAVVSIDIPDQITNPGKLTIKTWSTTATAGSTFSKLVHWVAFGR